MGSMKKLEQTLARAGRTDVAEARGAAAGRLAEQAANDGLLDVAYTTLELAGRAACWSPRPRAAWCAISFGEDYDHDHVLLELAQRVSPRVIEAPSYFDGVQRELEEYFPGRRTRFELPLDWRLTGGFGRRVLKRTAKIPYGKVSTYKEMAEAAGSPRGARAAGNALGSNPIPIVVPCHRVLHSGGGLGGYGGGLDNKVLLLKLEGAIRGDGGGWSPVVTATAVVLGRAENRGWPGRREVACRWAWGRPRTPPAEGSQPAKRRRGFGRGHCHSVTVCGLTSPARSASSAPSAIARSWIARPGRVEQRDLLVGARDPRPRPAQTAPKLGDVVASDQTPSATAPVSSPPWMAWRPLVAEQPALISDRARSRRSTPRPCRDRRRRAG